jgi:hypothetical protein
MSQLVQADCEVHVRHPGSVAVQATQTLVALRVYPLSQTQELPESTKELAVSQLVHTLLLLQLRHPVIALGQSEQVLPALTKYPLLQEVQPVALQPRH